jgi:hypothetical protein
MSTPPRAQETVHGQKRREKEAALIAAIQANLPALWKLVADCRDADEELPYRFYHQSFKVYRAQGYTTEIVKALQALMPSQPLNEWFLTIVAEGTGKTFEMEHNKRWLEVTRPMLEAYFHARLLLDMVCKYGETLKEPQSLIDTGWGAVLYLYGLR